MNNTKPSPISALGIVIWLIAALFFLYEFFLRTFVGSVASQIIPSLHLNAETFSIIGSAYYAAYGLMQLPVGILADKFGVKSIMIFATLVCAGATYMFAHSAGFTSALISRLLMGFGSSFAFICLLVIAVTWFPKRFFGFFAGCSQFIGTMGPLLAGGPLIAYMAARHESWRMALTEISFIGVILAVLIILIVRTKPRENALVLLKHEIPLKIRLQTLFKNPQAWLIAIYSASVYVSIALLGAFWGTEYLQVQGLSQTLAAAMISLAWLGYAIACPVLGALSDIAKRRKPVLILCGSIGLIVTLGIAYAPLNHLHWVYGVLFFCLGVAASGQNLGFATISEHTDANTKATALGLNNAAIILSGAIIPPLASYFIYLSAGGNSSHLQPHDFMIAFSIMPILYGICLILSVFFIRETFCKPQKEVIKLALNH